MAFISSTAFPSSSTFTSVNSSSCDLSQSPFLHPFSSSFSFTPSFPLPSFSNRQNIFRTPTATMTSSTCSVAVSTSNASSTLEAVSTAISSATSKLSSSSSSPTAALILCTTDRTAEDMGMAIDSALPETPYICTTSCGATLSNSGPVANGVSVLLFQTSSKDEISLTTQASNADIENATKIALKSLSDDKKISPKQFLMFASPGCEESVIKTITEEYPNVSIFGGSSADNAVKGDWFIFSKSNDVITEGLSLLSINENSTLKVGTALIPPYLPTDTKATITECSGRAIKTLDNKPAAKVLCEWMGKSKVEPGNIIVESATFPLGIKKTDSDEYIGVHAAEIMDDGSVGLFAEVTKDEILTVMKHMDNENSSSVQVTQSGLEMAYKNAIQNGQLDSPQAGIMIYCGGLSIAVGEGLKESLKGMAEKVPMLGMTAFGEQGSFDKCTNVHSNLAVGIALFE